MVKQCDSSIHPWLRPARTDALKARGYVIYAGQGDLATRVFRVANMGHLTVGQLRGFLTALMEVLTKEESA